MCLRDARASASCAAFRLQGHRAEAIAAFAARQRVASTQRLPSDAPLLCQNLRPVSCDRETFFFEDLPHARFLLSASGTGAMRRTGLRFVLPPRVETTLSCDGAFYTS